MPGLMIKKYNMICVRYRIAFFAPNAKRQNAFGLFFKVARVSDLEDSSLVL